MVGGGRNGHASEIGHPAVAAGDIVFGKIEGGEDEHPTDSTAEMIQTPPIQAQR